MIENLLRRDRTIVLGLIILLFALAGIYTVLGVGMDMTAVELTSMRDMPGATAPGQWSSFHVLLVFLMWWVMMVAMMLPSVSPTVLLYSALLRRRSSALHVAAISAAFLSGYLATWAVFSAAATAAHWALEALGLVSATMMTFRFLFSALKIAATTCVIGAIVSEWIGADVGLGALIIDSTFNYRSPLLYATVFMSSGLSVLLFASVTITERLIVRW